MPAVTELLPSGQIRFLIHGQLKTDSYRANHSRYGHNHHYKCNACRVGFGPRNIRELSDSTTDSVPELSRRFWPTQLAVDMNPMVVERMNNLPKVVFSRTLHKVSWRNTRLLGGELAAEVRKLKREPGPNMVIMGTVSIVAQLVEAGLIDEYQIVVNPLVLGKGRTLFDGVGKRLALKLNRSGIFGNGSAAMYYEPLEALR